MREARTALRWVFEFLSATVPSDGVFDVRDVFSKERVESYVDGLDRPSGTLNAIRSTLRRVHPEIGFAGTTRPTKTASNIQAPPAVGSSSASATASDAAAGTVPDAVGGVSCVVLLDGWVPSLLPVERWVRVEPVVFEALSGFRVATRARALDVARSVTYLAAWAESACRPLRVESVLSAVSIEEFLRVLVEGGAPDGSLRTFASNLHAVREANGLPLDVARMAFEKPSMNDPYSQGEVDALFVSASRINDVERRRHAVWALDLVFGTGALPAEAALVRGTDITEEGARVVLAKPVRAVPTLERYRGSLAEAARLAGAGFVLGGSGVVRRNRFRQVLGPTSLGEGGVDVSWSRSRVTWLVEVATTPGLFPSLAELWDAVGVESLQAFDRLSIYIRNADATAGVVVGEGGVV